MPIPDLLHAVTELKESDEAVDRLQEEKNTLQTRIAAINTELVGARTRRANAIFVLKSESGKI